VYILRGKLRKQGNPCVLSIDAFPKVEDDEERVSSRLLTRRFDVSLTAGFPFMLKAQ
jgi:hypothetical protein